MQRPRNVKGIIMPLGDSTRSEAITLEVSDPSQLAALLSWLCAAGVEATTTPGEVASGELGGLDFVTVAAASGSGLVAAIKVLPDFIRARRSSFRLKATVRGRSFTLDATNVDELLPILERLLDE